MRRPLSEPEWEEAGEHSTRRAISPPLVISGRATPEGLPKPWELQTIGREVLEASARSDRYKASLGRWSIDVRPIRESSGVLRLSCGGGPGRLPAAWHGKGGRSEDRGRARSGYLCIPQASSMVRPFQSVAVIRAGDAGGPAVSRSDPADPPVGGPLIWVVSRRESCGGMGRALATIRRAIPCRGVRGGAPARVRAGPLPLRLAPAPSPVVPIATMRCSLSRMARGALHGST